MAVAPVSEVEVRRVRTNSRAVELSSPRVLLSQHCIVLPPIALQSDVSTQLMSKPQHFCRMVDLGPERPSFGFQIKRSTNMSLDSELRTLELCSHI